MMKALPTFVVSGGLLGANIVALVTGVYLTSAGVDVATDAAPSQPMRLPVIPEAMQLEPLGAEAIRRPIFHRDRRPAGDRPDGAAGLSGGGGSPASTLLLRGLIIAGDSRRAALATSAGAVPVWGEQGERVLGWKLEEVMADEVRISNGAESRTIKLFEDRE